MKVSAPLLLITLFMLMVLLCSSVFCQNPDKSRAWRLSNVVTHNWGWMPNYNDWYRTDFYYNQSNATQIDSTLSYHAEADSVWSYTGRTIYGFEQLTDGYLVYIYSGSSEPQFPNYISRETRYDSEDKIIYSRYFSPNYPYNTELIIISSTTNTYNDAGKLILSVEYNLNSSPIHYWRHEYTYDGNNRMNYQRTYASADSIDFTMSKVTFYEYMTSGDTNRLYQETDSEPVDTIWSYTGRRIYEYSADGLETIINDYDFAGQGQWIYQGNIHFLYDNNGNLIRKYNDSVYANSGHYDFYYSWFNAVSNFDNTQNIISESGIRVYPNPFFSDTMVSFSIKENQYVIINLYNLKGQKVKTLLNEYKSKGHHTVKWDGKNNESNELPDGIYLMQIKQSGQIYALKIIKL